MSELTKVVLGSRGKILPAETARTVRALSDTGFVLVRAAGIEEHVGALYGCGERFFARSPRAKMRFFKERYRSERGYSPRRGEIAKYCRNEDGSDRPDEKEFFAWGDDKLWGSPAHRKAQPRYGVFYMKNVHPRLQGMPYAANRLFGSMHEIGERVLKAVGLELGYPAGHFARLLEDGASMMRLLNYPSLTEAEVGRDAAWGCTHKDLSFVTVLGRSRLYGEGAVDDDAGLWIKPRGVADDDKANWIRGIAPKGYVFVQVGNMLEMYTGGQMHSALHEVRAPRIPGAKARLSASLFVHPGPETVIDESGLQAGDYVLRELGAINL